MPTIKAKLGRLWSSKSLSAISVASVVAFAAIELSAGRDREVIHDQTIAIRDQTITIARQTAELKRQADELDRLAERSIRDRARLAAQARRSVVERDALRMAVETIAAGSGVVLPADWWPEGERP